MDCQHTLRPLLASDLAVASLHSSACVWVVDQRMDKKERFAGLCYGRLLPMLFGGLIDNTALAYGEQW